jgi:hypothetical protein
MTTPLTVNTVSRAGVNVTSEGVAATSGGDSMPNTGKEMLVLMNGDDAAHTVTLTYKATTDGQAISNRQVIVAAGDTTIIGPFPVPLYGNPVGWTYDAITSVDVAAISPGT